MTMLRSTSALCSLVVLSTLVILAVPLCSSLPSVARYELRLPLDINKTLMRAFRLLLDKFLDKMVGNFLVRRLSEDASDTQVESSSLTLSTSTTLSAGSSPSTSVPPTLIEKFDGTSSSSTPGVPFPSYIATPRDAAQPPALSTTLLVLLTGGALLFLSIIAVFFYCCVRFRRRRQSQALARKEAALEMGVRQSPGKKKRERWANDSEGGMRKGHGCASPSAFEFSPPSPTWRPTLPSLVFVSGNGGGDRAPISNAEMIMREREHGRWNGGGGGWLYGSCATGSGEPSHYSYASTSRRIAGVNAAPPLPAPAPRACHPPVYHRPSRIAPASHGASHAIPSSTLGRANSTTRSVHFAPPPAAPRALAVTVPRIQVYPAQDGPAPSIQLPMQTHTAAHGVRSTVSKTVGNPKTGNTGVGIKRTDCQRSGRPVSGLGISAIDVALNGANSAFSSTRVNTSLPYISAQPSAVARKSLVACPFEPSPRDLSGNQQRLDGGTSSVVLPCPSSPASDEDVRLAYTVSASSIRSATNSEPAARSKIRANEIVTTITKNENDGPLRTLAAQKSNAEIIAEMTSSKATPSINKDTSRLLVAGTNSFSQVSAFSSEARGGTASLTRSSSSERVSTPRPQGLGASTVDESAKGELHAMCSLGSESFDSLIAYLEDTVEPGDERKRNTVRVTSHQKQTSADPGERKNDWTEDRMESTRVTREDTARVDKDAYEAWVGSLNASSSILRLAHVEVSSGAANENRTSGRAGRRSRSTGTSGTRTGVAEAGPRVILRECDTNKDSRKMHAPNENGKVSHDARASVRGKVGIQVRALRARSASLKQNRVRGNSGSALENVPVDATRSGTSGVKVTAARPLSVKNLPQMEKEHQQLPSLPLATKSSLPLTALPSLSMLSSSTQLYAMFPSSEASSRSPSAPSIKVSNNTRRGQASAHIPTTSSSSNSVSVSTAASIVRCAQTPHAKTSAVLPFLSPSPTSVYRLSAGSMSSLESNTSTWGRRSEWGRESLTPRFDHLRAVLEGRSEDPPPLPMKSELHGERAVLDFADSFPLRLRI